MPITITITDGTVTPAEIVIPDNRARVTAAAVVAATGIVDPPNNDARAIRASLALWISTTRRQHRQATVRRASDAVLESTLTTIAADEDAARP
jgi:hypothetical protein